MSTKSTHEYLIALKDILLKEREHAVNLNMEGLSEVMKEKEELVNILSHIQQIDESDREIVTTIRQENRRNAYLFKTTLGWIRETMEFLGKRTVTSTYSPAASSVDAQVNGRLLSGRI